MTSIILLTSLNSSRLADDCLKKKWRSIANWSRFTTSLNVVIPFPKVLFAMCKLHVQIQIKVVISFFSNDSNSFLSNLLFTLGTSIPILIIIANTKKCLQSDWVRGVQYWSYLYSAFNICTLWLNKKKSAFDFRSGKIEMYSLKTN